MIETINKYLKRDVDFRVVVALLSLISVFTATITLIYSDSVRAVSDEEAVLADEYLSGKLIFLQGNTLASVSNPSNPTKRINMVLTAYSSTVWETDDTPFDTASGSRVRDGVVASNLLPFGTRIRIPELYGDKVFIVEDRMNSRVSKYHIDIWFPSYWDALSFGKKKTYIEVLEG